MKTEQTGRTRVDPVMIAAVEVFAIVGIFNVDRIADVIGGRLIAFALTITSVSGAVVAVYAARMFRLEPDRELHWGIVVCGSLLIFALGFTMLAPL